MLILQGSAIFNVEHRKIGAWVNRNLSASHNHKSYVICHPSPRALIPCKLWIHAVVTTVAQIRTTIHKTHAAAATVATEIQINVVAVIVAEETLPTVKVIIPTTAANKL